MTQRIGMVPDKLRQSVFDEMSELTDRRDHLQSQLDAAKRACEQSVTTADIPVSVISMAMKKFTDDIRTCPKEGLSRLLASMLDRVELRFTDVPYGRKTVRRLSGGKIHLKKSSEFLVAGTRDVEYWRLLPGAFWDFAVAV